MIRSNYTVDDFYTDIARLYESVNKKPYSRCALPMQLEQFGKNLEEVLGVRFIDYFECEAYRYIVDSQYVTIAFSGGKDSIALLLSLSKKNYGVNLLHMTGINKAYPDERRFVEEYYNKYGATSLQIKKMEVSVQAGDFKENPIKNNLLLAECLRSNTGFSVQNIGLGCSVLSDALTLEFGYSDSPHNLTPFSEGVEKLFGVRVFTKEVPSESLSYKILVQNNIDFSYVVSCMTPIRYREQNRKRTLLKRAVIRPNGCGNCYKCAIDYIHLAYYGVLPHDDISYFHYMQVLHRHWDHISDKEPESNEWLIRYVTDEAFVDVTLDRFAKSGVDLKAW